MGYNGTIELIAGVKPANNGNFPMVNAKDVYVDDDTRLDAKLNGLDDSIDDLNAAVVTDATLSQTGKPADAKAVGDAINNITIEVDATLSQSGKAADAKATGDAVGDLKTQITDDDKYQSDIIFAGKVQAGRNWAVGTVVYGVLDSTIKYRVANSEIQIAYHDLYITPTSGYQFAITFFEDGVYTSGTGFRRVTQLLPKGTEYKLTIAKYPEDDSITADIDTFVNALSVNSWIGDLGERVQQATNDIESANTKINKLEESVISNQLDVKITDNPVNDIVTVSAEDALKSVLEVGIVKQETTTGKNLLPSIAQTTTNNGVTFTPNADGSISISGTESASEATCDLQNVTLPAGSYVLTGALNLTYRIRIGKGENSTLIGHDNGTGLSFTLNEASLIKATIRISEGAGVEASGKMFPMIRLSTDTDATFEKYTGGAAPNPSNAGAMPIKGLPGYDTYDPVTGVYSRSPNFSDNDTSYYYALNVTDGTTTKWVGTTEKIPTLYEGDSIDFVSGNVIRTKGRWVVSDYELSGLTASALTESITQFSCTLTGADASAAYVTDNRDGFCNHFEYYEYWRNTYAKEHAYIAGNAINVYIDNSRGIVTTSDFTAWLAALAAASTPLTFVKALATPSTSTVTLSADLSSTYGTLTLTGTGTLEVTFAGDLSTYSSCFYAKAFAQTIQYAFKVGLPVIELSGDISAMSKDNEVTLNYRYESVDLSKTGTLTCKWQGASSLNYPRKNYTIKFDSKFEVQSGWGEQKKYVLKADYIDPSHLRNVGCAKLWGQIVASRNTVPTVLSDCPNYGAIDGFPIILIMNGSYMGVYNFNIPKDKWMTNMGDGESEAILCAERHVAATQFKATTTDEELAAEATFAVEYAPDESNISWITQSLNTAITAAINATSTTDISDYIDIDSAIDYYIFACLIAHGDGIDKNYLLLTYDGTKWYFSAYDMDGTLGNHWSGTSYVRANNAPPTISGYAITHRVMEIIKTYAKETLKTRYQLLRSGVLSEENIDYILRNYAAQIPVALLDEEHKLWPHTPGSNANSIDQINNWYRMRVKAIDAEINAL